jgi:hypothetical protein
MERYMMATRAYFELDDLSRNPADICRVNGEDDKDYIGRWFLEPRFQVGVHFPKETTRELTVEEQARYNGTIFVVQGGAFAEIILFPGAGVPSKPVVVRTRNSVYRFGEAAENGTRTVSRDNHSLDFTSCKISLLKKGMHMICTDSGHLGGEWETSTVLSIE